MAKKASTPKTNFFRDMVEKLDDEYTSIAADGMSSAEFSGFVDTGCLALNALLSGSIYGGIPNNKCIAFAGETTTGKTFFALSIMKNFLNQHPDGGIVYYDTEAAVTRDMMESRGLDTSRIIIAEPESIEKFTTHSRKFLAAYGATPEGKRPPLLMVLDSLGGLTTNKEDKDTLEGKDTKDMTLQQKIKAAFRVLRLKLAKLQVPIIVTNHVYTAVGQYGSPQTMSGGSGMKFFADQIVMLSKRRLKEGEKENTKVIGSLITAKTWKSRISVQDQKVELKLTFDKGLDRYYGLFDIAVASGFFKKTGNKYLLPDGTTEFGATIEDNPVKYIEPYLADIDKAARKLFVYQEGSVELDKVVEEVA